MAQLDPQDDQELMPVRSRWTWFWRGAGIAVVVVLALVGSFELVYNGKMLPGVSADGVYLGGMSRDSAASRLADKVSDFKGETLSVKTASTTVKIPVASLGVTYDNTQAVSQAYAFGHSGNLWQQAHDQFGAILGVSHNFSAVSYDDAKLSTYVNGLVESNVTPVSDATLAFSNNQSQVTPGTAGSRLDIGRLTQAVNTSLDTTDAATITAPTYHVEPFVNTEQLQAVTSQADRYVSAPIQLASTEINQTIDQATIISWLKIDHRTARSFLDTRKLEDIYPSAVVTGLSLDPNAIKAYTANLTSKLDQNAQDAVLGMVNGTLTAVTPSHDGIKLDQDAALADITSAVEETSGDRTVQLKMDTTKAAVTESDISSLGITDLISEGTTYFAGSPAARMQNIKAGEQRFNNVLIKPGQRFSFNDQLGDIGPQYGYAPELVIIGNHEEYQYGGGLCQVSTTAYRAALLAGLPINERHNHSFAVVYYTKPYGVQGVDATIYPPSGVDLQFTNDTGAYILIQTHMVGTTLTFDFYGTKTKTGDIRGPYVVSGSTDPKVASQTVFYRDVKDLSGNVVKTDAVNTSYQSSLDFPIN